MWREVCEENKLKKKQGKVKSSFPFQAGILLHILQFSIYTISWPEAKNQMVMEMTSQGLATQLLI